jgi:hypothetical protein
MKVCLDIDGTLCTNTDGRYEDAVPFPDVIAEVARVRAAGHRVILYTARGNTTGIDWRQLTIRQLAQWGVPYDELVMGKPTADVYIDDRAINSTDWKRARYALTLPG